MAAPVLMVALAFRGHAGGGFGQRAPACGARPNLQPADSERPRIDEVGSPSRAPTTRFAPFTQRDRHDTGATDEPALKP